MQKNIRIISCKIFQPELEAVLGQLSAETLCGRKIEIAYLHAGLHRNPDKLGQAVIEALDTFENDIVILLYGSRCHYQFSEILKGSEVSPFTETNCVNLIKPDASIYEEDRIYVTTGWIKHWRELSEDPFGNIDEVDARQAFGRYDTMILCDTGVANISDEEFFEVFDIYGVPIETVKTDIGHFKARIAEAIEYALEKEWEKLAVDTGSHAI